MDARVSKVGTGTSSYGEGEITDIFIPAADYRGKNVAELEKERLWPRVWQLACREEDIPKVGDFVNFEIYDESILVVRTDPDEIKAFFNACQHRGRRIVEDERGHLNQFYCRFHGWKYDLNGDVTHIHHRDDWADCPAFDESNLNLKSPSVDRWAGWVWINPDSNAEPLRNYLEEIPEYLDPFEFEKTRIKWGLTIHAPVNWKVVIEAFHEGYHTLATHISGTRTTTKVGTRAHGKHAMFFGDANSGGMTAYKNEAGEWVKPQTVQETLLAHRRHIFATLKAMTLEPELAATERWANETAPNTSPSELMEKLWQYHLDEYERRGLEWPSKLTPEAVHKAGMSWHIFPSTIVLPTPDGGLWYRLRPDVNDPSHCIFDIWCYGRVPKGEEPKVEQLVAHGFDEATGVNPFLEEDFENMVAVQKGMQSQGWAGALTNPYQEITVHNFHKMLRCYLIGHG